MNHPIHPLIVHFPIACWSLGTLGDLLNITLKLNLEKILGITIAIGCGIGLVAMMAGLYELLTLKSEQKEDKSINQTLDKHMYAAISAWSFYAFSLLQRWQEDHFIAIDYAALSTSVLGFICLAITGWYGGNLVYRFGVGTSLAKNFDSEK